MTINPLSLIEKLINEHGSSVILKERLLLLKDELAKIEKERTQLAEKCTAIEKENAKLRKQLNEKLIPDEFTEYMGALFKRDMAGSYAPIAYCIRCKEPLWNNEPSVFPYECSKPGCGYTIMIHEKLTSIADKLNKKNS